MARFRLEPGPRVGWLLAQAREAQERQVRFAEVSGSTCKPHMKNDVGAREEIGTARHELRAFFLIRRVGEAGALARSRFDEHIEARLLQRRDRGGDERDPPLARKSFRRHSDFHVDSLFLLRRHEKINAPDDSDRRIRQQQKVERDDEAF